MRCSHLTWSSEGRMPLFPDEARRRAAVRALARFAGGDMALFCVVDDHVHVVLYGEAGRERPLARSLTLALRPLAATALDAPHLRQVHDRSHLTWLADRYVLSQPAKHGLHAHPAVWSGSCFQDLAGARALPGLRLRLADAMPRYRVRRAYRAVGLPETPLRPATDAELRAAGAARLATAAAAALAADPALQGRAAPEVQARRAAAHLAAAAGIRTAEVAFAMGITRVAVARLLHRPVDPPVLQALRTRLALEDAALAAPRMEAQPPPSADRA